MSARPEPKPTRGLAPLLPLDAALDIVRREVSPHGRTERVGLADAAGRVLGADVHADLDQPAFDRSMMDGVAIRAADCPAPGTVLTGAGASPAGLPHQDTLAPGTFVRVMTGGVVPPGADSVVPVERIHRVDGDPSDPASGRWSIDEPVRPGQHVALTGCEVRRGDVVVPRGARLTPARVGVLAAFGHAEVEVSARPRVTVLPTGTEIVPVEATPQLGQVRNSNAWALGALFQSFGGEVRVAPAAIDEQAALDNAFARARESADLVVTCGGVSMGDYDLVVGSLQRLGARVHFHRVRIKPGKPVLLAHLGETLVLGLPGNPVSATVCGTLFGRVAMARLSGATHQRWARTQAPAAALVRASKGREEVRPATWATDGAGPHAVQPLRLAGSADLAHFAAGDVLLRRPPHAPEVAPGGLVDIWLWPAG